MKRVKNGQRTEIHIKLANILQDYDNPEFGDSILDEICELFNYPLTPEED